MRYSRQILFTGIGEQGQQRLAHSRVVIIGCGALGAMQAEMLARAGIGALRLVDRDFVEESNLQRQVLYDERDACEHLPKAVAAAARLGRINSEIAIESVVTDVNYANVERLISDADVVVGHPLGPRDHHREHADAADEQLAVEAQFSQRFRSAWSWSLGSIQRAPAGPCSFFQKGARLFR